MTIALSLTRNQEENLSRLSAERGVDFDTILLEIVRKALDDIGRLGRAEAHSLESQTSGAICISEALAVRLTEKFWLGAE